MKKDTIIKFLNNRCTDDELEEVIQWAKTKALDKESESWGFDDWESYQTEYHLGDDEKYSLLFDKIQRKIGEKRSSGLTLFTTWLTRAAAILLIPILSLLLYTLSEKRVESSIYANHAVDSLEIIAPVGSRTVVQLSDGSLVHLNYGSKIKYPHIFSGDSREVKLTGEGYFDVTHNPDKPFIVKTEKLNVKALGTAFNVLAYPNDNVIETTLVNGKVILEQKEANGKIKSIGAMVPGQHLSYNIKSGAIYSTKGSIEEYIAWKDGRLVFENASIYQIAERLERMFNVEIEVSDDIKDYLYTVTFIDEPLFQILDLMTIATPVSYRVLPREKLPDGTFSKQKVTIKKKIR